LGMIIFGLLGISAMMKGSEIIIRFMIFGVTSWVVFIRKTLGQ
jgi:hypothetical protein